MRRDDIEGAVKNPEGRRTTPVSVWRRSFTWRLLLVAAAYGPLLVFGSRRLNADTKLYLYTDPVDLMNRALNAWDSSQFGGYVPHQAVGYLWPMGPWFRGADLLGVPDWLAQRLWLGTVFLVAALGVRRFLLHLCPSALAVNLSVMKSSYPPIRAGLKLVDFELFGIAADLSQ